MRSWPPFPQIKCDLDTGLRCIRGETGAGAGAQGETLDAELVIVRTFGDRIEAEMARSALEAASCECYKTVRALYDRLLPPQTP